MRDPGTDFTSINRAAARDGPYGASGDEVDAARAREYALLSVLLRRAPNAESSGRLVDASVAIFLRSALRPYGACRGGSRSQCRAQIEREFFDLFIGIGRGELLPYGSYYLTGFLNERPLARLRDDLARLGIERVEGEVEPEDHAAVLCEIMAGLAMDVSRLRPEPTVELFEKHLAPWIGRFFADLEQAKSADFYRRVGAVGRVFMR